MSSVILIFLHEIVLAQSNNGKMFQKMLWKIINFIENLRLLISLSEK